MLQAFDTVAAALALAALIGVAVLLVLWASQRRDLVRLRRWHERAPDHPELDVEASEAILDRAERDLEDLLGIEPPPPTDPGLELETSERPALAQYTAEWEALHPESRLSRVQRALSRPRYAAAVVLVAMAAGLGAVVLSLELLSGSSEDAGSDEPAIEVAVVNATPQAGRGAEMAARVERRGFELGPITNAEDTLDQSVVMFAAGRQAEARRVAGALRIEPLQPIDQDARQAAPGSDVVVIVGRDAARR